MIHFLTYENETMNKSSKQFYLKTDKKIACPRIVFEYTDTLYFGIVVDQEDTVLALSLTMQTRCWHSL